MTNPSTKPDAPRIVYPKGELSPERLPRWIATPLSWLYRGVSTSARNTRLPNRPAPPDGVCIVSVGNLEVGGNGKTPFAIHLIERLVAAGQRPVYVSRGYNSAAERRNTTTAVLPAAGGPITGRCHMVERSQTNLAREVGDEGAVVARRCTAVPLAFDRDRGRAVKLAMEAFEPTHIVLDDAFQTWRAPRHFDVVLLDAERPFGNGQLLPAGTLREAPSALARADAVGINGVADAAELSAYTERVADQAGVRLPVFGMRRKLSFVDGEGKAVDPPRRAAALSAIARPQGFDDALDAAGVELSLSIRYPDHFRYGASDREFIEARAAEHDADCLVTTEKDWVKLGAGWQGRVVYVARLELDVVGFDSVWAQIEKPRTMSAASAQEAVPPKR